MKWIHYLLLSFALSSAVMAVEIKELPPKLTLSEALFNHCLELTQSQQLLKEYILIGLGITYKNPKKTLPESITKYDKRLKTLHVFFQDQFTDEKDKKQFSEGVALWGKIKERLGTPPTQENALLLLGELATMYKKLKATKVLTEKSFAAVKVTGRICYSSQEMANLYLMKKAWKINLPDYDENIKTKMTDFEKKLQILKSFESNTDEINQSIASAEKAYGYFAFMYNAKTIAIPALITKKADDIFMRIATIKKLYGEMLKKK